MKPGLRRGKVIEGWVFEGVDMSTPPHARLLAAARMVARRNAAVAVALCSRQVFLTQMQPSLQAYAAAYGVSVDDLVEMLALVGEERPSR